MLRGEQRAGVAAGRGKPLPYESSAWGVMVQGFAVALSLAE